MRCAKCGRLLSEEGVCQCGFTPFMGHVNLFSELLPTQAAELTSIFSKDWKCGPDGHLFLRRKSCTWGPKRPTYTMSTPAKHAVLNSLTDNAAVGDERNFVRISEKSSGLPYRGNIIVEPDRQYEVYIYFHNNASSTYNDKEHDYVGVARDVRLSSVFPTSLKKGQEGLVRGTFSSTNTDPPSVWAGAYITATEDMTLHYVEGSAKIYHGWQANGRVLSVNLFSKMGTFIGMNELNGVVPGCDDFSGQVVYTIQTRAVKQKAGGETSEEIAV